MLRGKMALQAADLNLGDINLVLETHHVLTASFSLPQLFFFLSSTVIFIVSIHYLKQPGPFFH